MLWHRNYDLTEHLQLKISEYISYTQLSEEKLNSIAQYSDQCDARSVGTTVRDRLHAARRTLRREPYA